MEKRRGSVGMDLTEGKIFSQLMLFVVPLLLANLVQQLYNTVDMMVIGQYVGSAGSTGVSTGGEIAGMITFIASAFGSAGQIYVAQLFGAKDHRAISETISTSLVFSIGLSLAATLLCVIFCDPLLRWLNCPEEAFQQAHDYMMIVSLGLPFVFGYNMVCGILRGVGEARRPLLFITVAAVANVVMDILLVAVIPLEAAGTAIATVAAELASFLAAFVYLYRRREQFGITFCRREFRINGQHLRVLLRLGIPLSVQTALIHFTLILCTREINSYGIVAATTNSIGNRVQRMINVFASSVNQGAGTMVGQNIGAKKYDRVRRIVGTTLLCSGVCSLTAILAALLIAEALFSLFLKTDDPNFAAILEMGRIYMRIGCIAFALTPVQGSMQAVVTGSGNARLGMLAGLLDGLVLRLGISYFLAWTCGLGVYGFFYGNALAHLGPVAVCTAYYLSGKWITFNLLERQGKRQKA